jgi:hypothetical protein
MAKMTEAELIEKLSQQGITNLTPQQMEVVKALTGEKGDLDAEQLDKVVGGIDSKFKKALYAIGALTVAGAATGAGVWGVKRYRNKLKDERRGQDAGAGVPKGTSIPTSTP